MRRLTYILLVLSINTGFAQLTPGYLGKKNVLKFDMMVSPGLYSPGYNKEAGFRNMNSDISIGFGRVLSKRAMFELAVAYGRTSFEMEDYILQNGNQSVFYEGYNEDIPETKCVFYKYDLRYTRYFNTPGNITPLGSYHSYVLSVFNNYIGEKPENEEIYFIKKNNPILLSAYFGNRDIYGDFFLVDFSFGIGLSVNPVRYSNTDLSLSYNPTFDSESIKRISNMYFLQIKVGLGFVL